MLCVAESRIDYLIEEDIPYIDLTSEVLGIGKAYGSIEYFTREDCLLCCTEEAVRIMNKMDIEIINMLPSGSRVSKGESFLKARGSARALHKAWKVCLNLFDYYSAIATKTAEMVNSVKEHNPQCEILATRKSPSGIKDLLVKAIMTGGAFPHRLGLSETVLVFEQHLEFLGGFNEFIENLPTIRSRCIEKKLFVEASAKQAMILAHKGIDGIQFDKIPAVELVSLVKEIRSINAQVTLIAAGGINPGNAAEYALTGVDGLATTSLFSAQPLDMSVRMQSIR